MKLELKLGNSLEVLKEYPDNHFDSVVTDPPYGLSFMGKKWDYEVPTVELWEEVLRVLKPGGHLVSFSSSRTYHRMTVNVEDAGFEVRDQLMWLYGSGFPKSHNIGKSYDKKMGIETPVEWVPAYPEGTRGATQDVTNGWMNEGEEQANGKPGYKKQFKPTNKYEGWGTALKPAHEPIVLARKPLSEKTIVDNVIKWGTGGINIDSSRVAPTKENYSASGVTSAVWKDKNHVKYLSKEQLKAKQEEQLKKSQEEGRFPANIIHDGSDEVTSEFPEVNGKNPARYFYCAKVGKKERNAGVDKKLTKIDLIWKSTEGEDHKVTLQADTVVSHAKVTEEYGVELKRDLEWSTELFGKNIMGRYQKDFSSTISTKTKLITRLETYKWLIRLLTSDWIPAVIWREEFGINNALLAKKLKEQTIITQSKEEVSCINAKFVLEDATQEIEVSVSPGRSNHPTVKPVALMAYLCKLITPKGGTILDPFMGSGSTGMAAKQEGFNFTGIDLDEAYVEIAQARIDAWK